MSNPAPDRGGEVDRPAVLVDGSKQPFPISVHRKSTRQEPLVWTWYQRISSPLFFGLA
jgi:hypothetical protein